MCVIMDQAYKEPNVEPRQPSKTSASPLSKIPAKKNVSCLPRPITFPYNPDMSSERRAEHNWLPKQDVWPELSRLRQENIRLQKEMATKEKEALNFREKVLSVTKENTTLMEELSRITLDNHKLKMKLIAVMEENDTLHSKLSRPAPSFRTYPWSESVCLQDGKNCSGFGIGKSGNGKNFLQKYQSELNNDWRARKSVQTESWEEVSQKLLQQMKREMQELEDLGQKLAIEAGATGVEDPGDEQTSDSMFSSCNNDFSDDDENCTKLMKDLKDQSTKIKQLLQSQNSMLKDSIQNVIFQSQRNANDPFEGTNYQLDGEEEGQTSLELQNILDNRLRFARPSDESFRAYFKQQLSGSSEWAAKKPTVIDRECNLGLELNGDKRSADKSRNNADDRCKNNEVKTSKNHRINSNTSRLITLNSGRQTTDQEERVCPVCQDSFPKAASQKEYETHVMAHFEEHLSLVQQYEVI